MTTSNSINKDDIQFPEGSPWGMAVYADFGAKLLRANEHMLSLYFDADSSADSVTQQFRFRLEGGWDRVLKQLQSEGHWSGRVVPLSNQHGISSVELSLHLDAKVAGRIWLYTMEHPCVAGDLRFSSRSELKMLQVLLDNTLEYVFFRDTTGRFILTNRAFRQAIALGETADLAGETIRGYISEESAAWVASIDRVVVNEGIPSVNKVSHVEFKNGTEHWLQMSTLPVRSSEGIVVGSVSVARDISDLKRTESDLREAIKDARAASQAKSDFLAAMSHEIRTPINGIVGASELCLDTTLDFEQRDYLETVVQCSGTLMSLINDVLDFSKIEAGQLNLETLNFSPISLMEDVASEFGQRARAKGLELVVSYDNEVPEFVLGDPTRMKQVLYNLVGNAIKFTEKGEVVMRAETIYCSDSKARLRFSVADTGIGIDTSRRDLIFSSFTQADMTTTRKYGGTGLGLTICKDLAELMGGTISVESVLGAGSTFIVELPFERSACSGAEVIPFNPELAGLRVLVVDDTETNRDIYCQMCVGWGYRSASANGGGEALELLEAAVAEGDPYSLILLDQHMPGMTGLDFAKVVSSRADLLNPRILLLSSSVERKDANSAKEIGISRVLLKPVRRSTLLEVILETFGVHGSQFTAISKPDPTLSGSPPDCGMHILLAEDNELNQKIACRRLEKLGHTVTVSKDGNEVLRLLEISEFDCILMDIQMPHLDGYETTRRIRAKEASFNLSPTFIIAMTAHAMAGVRERCLDRGMNEYISKPFRLEKLKEVLSKVSRKAVRAPVVGRQAEEPVKVRVPFIDRLRCLDEEDRADVNEVAAIFVQTLPDELKRFEMALGSRDCQQIRFVAHSLKGVANIFMSEPCVELAASVEQACDAKDLDLVDHSAEELVKELALMGDELAASRELLKF